MQPIEQFYPFFEKPFKAVITSHQKPDGDAMGSSLALYHFLIQLGHNVTVVSPTNWAPFLDWMPGIDKVIDYESNSNLLTTLLRMTKKKINVNRVRYQMKDNETATCGIHSAIRCVFNEYTNSEYYKMISSMANGIIGDNNQSNYDKLVSLMSVLPLKYSIPT